MEIQLSDHFTYTRLIRFTLPSIAMMIFTSIYGVVDGYFVANYVGGTQFAAMNLILPFIMVLSSLGFMFGTGGSALVSMVLGMGEDREANEIFSLLTYVLMGLGVLVSLSGFFGAQAAALRLGATNDMLPYCVIYTRISMLSLPFYMLQSAFHSFMITAERPQIGFYMTLAAGLTNMVLDWLFMGVLGFGIGGAAAATVIGEYVGGGIPLLFFASRNGSLLRLGRARFRWKYLLRTVSNGASELLSNLSMSFVSMLYNFQLMRYAGENGVAAYGILMYVNFIFVSVFLGYSIGVSPVIGFHYGAEDKDELANLFGRSIKLIAAAAVCMLALSLLFAAPIARFFAAYDESVVRMTIRAFRFFAPAFLFMGFNIFGSGFFTALNNGLISAVISFMRILVFETAAVIVLPLLLGLDGIWASITAAEILSTFLTAVLVVMNRERYGYM